MNEFTSIETLAEELRAGRCVVLVDDEDRENEGDLICAAEFATPETVNFMITHGRGLVCLALTGEQCARLELPPMAGTRTGSHGLGTAFTVSIDALEGTGTGISAADRACTITTAIRDDSSPGALARPGHVFPLQARDGGVLVRPGHTEASVDLCRLAGLKAAGVICEIMNDDGTMARLPELRRFCDRHHLQLGSIADLVEHRLGGESLIERRSSVRMPTEYGDFSLHVYRSEIDNYQHLALVKGPRIKPVDLGGKDLDEPILLRVHSECCTGDIFGSLRCDCRFQLHAALRMIEKEGEGLLLYMRQEGRGIGLEAKLDAYALQDDGLDTVEANERLGYNADERNYGIGSQILRDLGIRKMRLMSNNPRKLHGLQGYGVEVVERVPIEIEHNPHNVEYLKTKKAKLGHLLRNV